MRKSVYNHVDSKEFYMLYNIMRLYFTTNYDVAKYGMKSKKIADRYEGDKLKKIYELLSLKIPDIRKAMFLIISNFLINENNFITTFDLEPDYYKLFIRYNNNKHSIIDDFSELCMHVNVFDKIKTGELSDDVIIRKQNFILFAYINKVIPMVDLSLENLSVPDAILDLFYGGDEKEDTKSNIFKKVSYFLHISEKDKLFLKPKLNEILINNKQLHLND